MKKIDEIFIRLSSGEEVGSIRLDIANLIAEHLYDLRDSLGYWEKAHFAQAIASLGWNMNSSNQPTGSWLRLSLVNLEKALVPAEARNESYGKRDGQLDALTYEQLLSAIQALGGQVPRTL